MSYTTLARLVDINGVINKTYDELVTLVSNSELIIGQKYVITDFRTVYRKPNGYEVDDYTVIQKWLTDGRETDPNPSLVEPLMITAATENKFAAKAISLLYPEDIIYFSFDEDMGSLTKGYEMFDNVNTKGFIYRRINKNKVDMPYDFRNVKWRRWEVDYTAISVWNTTSTYYIGQLVRNSGTANNIIYVATKSVSANQNPTASDSTYWIPLMSVTTSAYLATSNTYDNYGSLNNGWAVVFDRDFGVGYTNVIVPVTGNYRDLSTFSMNNGLSDISVDSYRCRNNSVKSGYNFIFYSNGNNFYYNTIGNNFNSNTIGNNFNSNTIGNNFNSNTIGNNFYYNTIGNNFNSNTIGNYFYSNTIGNYFYYNTIGNNFYSNTIGNYFNSNTIGNYFYSNTIGTGLYNNTYSDGFRFNTIKDGVHETNFSSVAELHGKDYNHTIEINSNGSAIFWWFNAINQIEIYSV